MFIFLSFFSFLLIFLYLQFMFLMCYLKDSVDDNNHDPLSVPPVSPPSSGEIKPDKKKPSENISLADNSLLVSFIL